MIKVEYTLSEKEEATFKAFKAERDAAVLEEQRTSMSAEDFRSFTMDGKHPYTGAIGGGLTWLITHTGIGTAIEVEYLGERRNITDYDGW